MCFRTKDVKTLKQWLKIWRVKEWGSRLLLGRWVNFVFHYIFVFLAFSLIDSWTCSSGMVGQNMRALAVILHPGPISVDVFNSPAYYRGMVTVKLLYRLKALWRYLGCSIQRWGRIGCQSCGRGSRTYVKLLHQLMKRLNYVRRFS